MAIYESMEYMCCYDDEKKKHKKHLKQLARERQCIEGTNSSRAESSENTSESTRLLDAEDIPMQTLLTPSERSDISQSVDTIQETVLVSVHDHGSVGMAETNINQLNRSNTGTAEANPVGNRYTSQSESISGAALLPDLTQNINQSEVTVNVNADDFSNMITYISQSESGEVASPDLLADVSEHIPRDILQSLSQDEIKLNFGTNYLKNLSR